MKNFYLKFAIVDFVFSAVCMAVAVCLIATNIKIGSASPFAYICNGMTVASSIFMFFLGIINWKEWRREK